MENQVRISVLWPMSRLQTTDDQDSFIVTFLIKLLHIFFTNINQVIQIDYLMLSVAFYIPTAVPNMRI